MPYFAIRCFDFFKPIGRLARSGGMLLAITTFFVTPAWAQETGTLTVGSNIEFSGGQAPASATTPWISMTVSDNGTNSVIFDLQALHLSGSENVSEFDFNLDPALAADVGALTFSNPIFTGAFDAPQINQGVNAYKADGDGLYDLQLLFTTGGNLSKTFSAGDSIQYTITGAGISAESFDFLSQPAGGHGPFVTAAHIQNTTGAGSGGSGWVADSTGGEYELLVAPEPSTLLLSAIGAAGALIFTRHTVGRRRATAQAAPASTCR